MSRILVILLCVACSETGSGPNDETPTPRPPDYYDVAGVWRIAAVNDSSFHLPGGGLGPRIVYWTPCEYGPGLTGTDSAFVGPLESNQLTLERSGSFQVDFSLSTLCYVPGIGGTIGGGGRERPHGSYAVTGTRQDSISFSTTNVQTFGLEVIRGVASGEAGYSIMKTGAKRLIPAFIRVEFRKSNDIEDWQRSFSITFRHGTVPLPQ
jgi:hypothetical protein